jgi:hypothetical protein
MIAKTLIAAAAIATTFAVAAPVQQAEAKTNIDINIGLGAGSFYPGFYPSYYSHPGYISCHRGKKIVDYSGFNKVNAVDCSLPGYKYTAWKHGHKYFVRVNGNGRITNVNRIF